MYFNDVTSFLVCRQFEEWRGERQHIAQLSSQRFLYPNQNQDAENDPLGPLPHVS